MSSRFSKSAILAALTVTLTATGCASSGLQSRRLASTEDGTRQVVYYSKEARKLFLASVPGFKAGTQATEKVLMVKTYDRAGGRFKEIACINDGKQPPYISPVYMKVEGGRISAISDTRDFEASSKLTGTGTLSGAEWDWNLLTFSMSYQVCPLAQCKSRVMDTNFIVRGLKDDGTAFEQIIGRKQLFLGDGTPFELYDLEMDKISVEAGKALFSEMGCPAEKLGQLFDLNF